MAELYVNNTEVGKSDLYESLHQCISGLMEAKQQRGGVGMQIVSVHYSFTIIAF